MKQLVGLKGVEFTKFEYDKMIIPTGSVIYCDPPYEGTTGYKYGFDHVKFWEWCRQKAREGHEVFISE